MWYTAELLSGFDIMLGDVVRSRRDPLPREFDPVDNSIWMYQQINDIITAVKRENIFLLKSEINALYELIGDMLKYVHSTPEKCAEQNIKKLKSRYPYGFDPKISMERYKDG